MEAVRAAAQKAKDVLDEAASLPSKCPEWYLVMQQVAQAQGWGLVRATDLFKQAAAFAPDYYYYCRALATYMLPKWEGQDGDTAGFVEQQANHAGGIQGDTLYFEIASDIACACDEPEFNRMSWPRMQKGFAEIEKAYGSSMTNLNLMALMATKNEDPVAADAAFKRIGENWDKDAWITEAYFNQNKSWASQSAPLEAHSRVVLQEAAVNLQSAGGAQYQKDAEQTLAAFMRQRVLSTDDRDKFEFMLQVAGDGVPKDAWMRHLQPSPPACCNTSMSRT